MTFETISLGEKNYPPLLKEISNPPKKLYFQGTLPSAELPTIAIVGTRKAGGAGIRIAEEMAAELAASGAVVVSGLAMGIDAAAHRGALRTKGRTVAVLGSGIDKIYPAQNEKLAKELLENEGAIISEYPADRPSFKSNFPERNRIISGLSLGVVIIEAPLKSGALITAGFAAEQGRTVFVVPGPVKLSNYAGSHALIRDGATLVTKASEVLEDLGLQSLGSGEPTSSPSLSGKLDPAEHLIMEALKMTGHPLEIDRITSLTKLEPQAVNQTLTSLLLKGLIRESSGKYEIGYR